MARKRYTAEEIIGQLRTIEIELGKGLAVVEVCRRLIFVGLCIPRVLICYHAATRTGQTSPICTHVRSRLTYGFLWG